jgi:predicted HTH domain antitoxin
MNIEVTIPNEIFTDAKINVPRYVLEQIAVSGYKSNKLSMVQVRKLLDFSSRFETEEFLHLNNAFGYTKSDLEEDLQTLKDLGLR